MLFLLLSKIKIIFTRYFNYKSYAKGHEHTKENVKDQKAYMINFWPLISSIKHNAQGVVKN